MKKYVLLLLLLLLFAGCGQPPRPFVEWPTVNPPLIFRQENWAVGREGSCVVATTITLLRWQGHCQLAERFRQKYEGGEYPEKLAAQMEAEGIRYAYTSEKNDVAFLEWAIRTRRGCGVTIEGGSHMVALVHLDKKWAGLLDDNDVSHYVWLPRERFLAEWAASTSWAVTPIYDPAAPLPPK
jgi:hypothetical protein